MDTFSYVFYFHAAKVGIILDSANISPLKIQIDLKRRVFRPIACIVAQNPLLLHRFASWAVYDDFSKRGCNSKQEQNDEKNMGRGGHFRRIVDGHVLFFPVETGKCEVTLSVGVQ